MLIMTLIACRHAPLAIPGPFCRMVGARKGAFRRSCGRDRVGGHHSGVQGPRHLRFWQARLCLRLQSAGGRFNPSYRPVAGSLGRWEHREGPKSPHALVGVTGDRQGGYASGRRGRARRAAQVGRSRAQRQAGRGAGQAAGVDHRAVAWRVRCPHRRVRWVSRSESPQARALGALRGTLSGRSSAGSPTSAWPRTRQASCGARRPAQTSPWAQPSNTECAPRLRQLAH